MIKCTHGKCRRTFLTQKKFEEHLKNHKEHACHLCTKTFPENFRLQQHLKTHEAAEEKTFKCPYEGCDHGYHVKHRLDVHIQSKHIKEKTHHCECGKSFFEKGSLKTHRLNCKGPKPTKAHPTKLSKKSCE